MTGLGSVSRRLITGVVAALVPIIPLVVAVSPATAATTSASATATTRRVAPVAGSADYLAYVVGTSSRKAYIPGNEKTGTLYVRSRSGKVRKLGAMAPDPDFSLVGSTLIEMSVSATDTEHVSWWDLASKAHGSFSVGGNESRWVVAAAPHGWLMMSRGAEEGDEALSYRHFDGTTTNLGHPTRAGVGYNVVAGAAGYVAYSNNDENGDGEIVYSSWKHPTKRIVLQKPGGVDGNFCNEVGTKWALCGLYDLSHSPVALIRLSDAKQVRTTARCRSPYGALVSAKAAWVNRGSKGCTKGRVEMFDTHGHITKSSRHNYNWRFQLSGLSRLVTTNQAQTKVLGLTKANGTPKVLARV